MFGSISEINTCKGCCLIKGMLKRGIQRKLVELKFNTNWLNTFEVFSQDDILDVLRLAKQNSKLGSEQCRDEF